MQMDFAGNALAPNVLTVKRQLAELSAQRVKEGASRLVYRFPLRGERGTGLGPGLEMSVDGESVDLMAGFGFAPFLDASSRWRVFSDESDLEAAYPTQRAASFMRAGLIGAGPLVVYSVSPFVMLVDREALGTRPVPAHWDDLLDPVYRGQVVISPEAAPGNVFVMSCYARHGEEGVGALLQNVAFTASASVMAMLPDHPRSVKASIYVTPWFFARISAMKDGLSMVWPEEGALSFPLWLALRHDASEGARAVADYFTGEPFARESAGLCLPCVHAASDEVMSGGEGSPEGIPCLSWVGWDFLERLDVEAYTRFAVAAGAGIRGVDEL